MDDVPTTNLTVAKLKALCVLNDVPATGKKDELLQRLMEAGVDNETLGIEVFDDSTATFQSTADGKEVVHDEDDAGQDDA
ncbi:MAG: SAP domain-containing protein, partial [Poseidonia sp.]